MTETTTLWLLGILVTALLLLVGSIYLTVKKAQEDTDIRLETHRVETRDALLLANEKREALRKELSENLRDAEADAEKTHASQWIEINKLKEQYNGIYAQHGQWCVKHEDAIGRLNELISVQESKIKGQGDFFNQRVVEFNKTVLSVLNKIKNLKS